MSKKQNDNYACGIKNEKKVAKFLEKQGMINVELSPGSRGSADISMARPSGRKALIQVKSTCSETGQPKMPTAKETERLIKDADAKNATAMIALVKGNKQEFIYAKTGRKVPF